MTQSPVTLRPVENMTEGTEVAIQGSGAARIGGTMKTMAVVMGPMGAYGETPAHVRARCVDIITATRNKVTVQSVAVAYLPTEDSEKGYQYYQFTTDEAESQKLWEIDGDERCTAVMLSDGSGHVVKIETRVNHQAADVSCSSQLLFMAYICTPEQIPLIPQLGRVPFKIRDCLDPLTIRVRGLITETGKAKGFRSDVEECRMLAGTLLKKGVMKHGVTTFTKETGGLEGVVKINVVATALRCGNEQAVREGKPPVFSGLYVELELTWVFFQKYRDWMTLALPCAIPWPSKVGTERNGENPIFKTGGKAVEINVWWGGASMEYARRCIMETKTSHGPKAMIALGGLMWAERIDATATIEERYEWRRSVSEAQRRNAAAERNDEARSVLEKWQELLTKEYGAQVGPVACRMAAHRFALKLELASRAVWWRYPRLVEAAALAISAEKGKESYDKRAAEACIECVRDEERKRGGCGGKGFPCCLVRADSKAMRSGKVAISSKPRRAAPRVAGR